jgi:hypothetical protein
MSGFGGAGAFSDGKYNITNDFGGTLYEYIGKKQALELMEYVDEINMRYGGEGTKLYSTAGSKFKKLCMQNDLHLLDASVRHLGTDINYIVLENLYAELKDKVEFFFDTPVESMNVLEDGEAITVDEYTILFRDPQSYTLIQIKRDPFTPLAAAGAVIVMIALILAFYLRTAEVLAKQTEDGSWSVSGYSRKGGAEFADRIAEKEKELRIRRGKSSDER